MEFLGCFVVLCIIALLFCAAIWLVVGTIMLLSKLIIVMAWLGAIFLVIGVLWGIAYLIASR